MSKKLPDLTGEHFGRWTVIEYAGRGNHGEVQYKCRCDCCAGKRKEGAD